ncbi:MULTISPECIES: AI-2E family transporter [Citricoccus]|uniref:AI-2E family transporter n=1 Tax=Citricoccus TaxID=169133 RepID=UPI000255F34B|nr:AI-2E family transporter [Citricoccus sp. CH26A]
MSTTPQPTPGNGAELAVPGRDPLLTASQQANRVATDVPYGLTVAAAWSWRVLLVLAMAGASIWLLSHVSLLVIPLIIAALLATLLNPVHQRFRRWGVPTGLSVTAIIIGFLAIIVGLLTLVGQQLTVGFTDMRDQIMVGVQGIVAWLASVGVTTDQWNDIFANLGDTVRNNSQQILSGALGFGSTAGNIAAGTVLAVFALIFFLYDGQRIWRFCLNFVPRRHREAIDGAGKAGWNSLGSYVRVQIFVAFVDAVGIGTGAWVLGVPLALPLGVLVFFGSFIPLVGAFLTGAVAVLLALVANGPVNALIMLGVVLLVQQIEGNVLQPLVMGRAVSLHPLAVFLAVSGGTAVLGLVGAVFAVPLMAFLNATIKYFHARPWLEGDQEPGPDVPREGTLKERAAELEGPWGRAYETIDGVVRKATGGADGTEGRGSTSVTERRRARRELKRSQTRSRFLPRRWRERGGAGTADDDGPDAARVSPDGGNVRGGTGPGEDNTGMDRSGRRPDQDGGHQ